MNLPLKLSHALNFLRDYQNDVENIFQIVERAVDEISNIKIEDENNSGKLRIISNKARKSIDKSIDSLKMDSDLFSDEMRLIIKNKNDEDVIYYLSKFKDLIRPYKKLSEKLSDFNDDIMNTIDKSLKDQDYIRMVALNKLSVPVQKLNRDIDNIVSRLNVLVGDDSDE